MSIHSKSPLDMGSQKVTSVLDPTSSQDAATKNYVDNQITNSGGIPIQNTKRVTHVSADGSTGVPQSVGDAITTSFGGTGGGIGAVAASSSLPAGMGGSAGTSTAGFFTGVLNYVTGRNIKWWMFGFIGRLTNARFWWGLTDNTAGNMSASDNPSGNYAAFRFSTAASDTNFQCITKDGTTQTVTDSGVAADLSPHKFAIWFDDANSTIRFYIDTNLVATVTTHRPTNNTPLRFVFTEVATNSVATGITLAQMVVQSDS